MALTPGTRLGPYEILSALGAGGMGEVYRARDTRLDRDVAIKILPEAFAADAERLARFQREAKVLASLNHPNIAIIHGLEHADGAHALVMELVEGEDLAQRIARGRDPARRGAADREADRRGARSRARAGHHPPRSEAREHQGAAGRHGEGARLRPGESDGAGRQRRRSVSQSPTITTPAMTQAGMILGTAAYMSPEQAKGKPVDKRSDIWAFGCVLYEMLTGRRAFEAEDVSDTLAAVLMNEPDWTALPATTPATVTMVLRRCLQKDRKRRARDIGDVSLALEGAFETTVSQMPVSVAKPAWRRALSLASFVLLAVVLLTAGAWELSRATPPLLVARFSIALPEGKSLSQTSRQNLGISPDGTQIVYASDGRLFSRALGDFEARALAGTGTVLNISESRVLRGRAFGRLLFRSHA